MTSLIRHNSNLVIKDNLANPLFSVVDTQFGKGVSRLQKADIKGQREHSLQLCVPVQPQVCVLLLPEKWISRTAEDVDLRSQDRNSCMLGNSHREDFFHKSAECSKLGSQSKEAAVLLSPWKKCYLGLPVMCRSLPSEAQAVEFLGKHPSQGE